MITLIDTFTIYDEFAMTRLNAVFATLFLLFILNSWNPLELYSSN